jgi:hypothetical protein
MMYAAIDNFTSCKVHTVIWFLHTKNMSALQKYVMNYAHLVYSQNVMSEGTVRQQYTVFKYGRRSVHNEEH